MVGQTHVAPTTQYANNNNVRISSFSPYFTYGDSQPSFFNLSSRALVLYVQYGSCCGSSWVGSCARSGPPADGWFRSLATRARGAGFARARRGPCSGEAITPNQVL